MAVHSQKPVFADPKMDLPFKKNYEREKMAEQDYRGGLALARKEGEARGEARGRRAGLESQHEALLGILAGRGWSIPEEVRARILGCEDLGQLTAWIVRAATSASLQEVFPI
jgi:hypothetical protein